MSFNDPAAFISGDTAFGGGPALRPLSWYALCARIAATQDLRRTMARESEDKHEAVGSFHQGAAAFLASAKSGVPAHERVVNPNSSANGKAPFATENAMTTETRHGRAEARD